jgi:putative membrane protein
MKPSQLLDPASRDRIVDAVRAAEKTTSGELVVAVVAACDEYSSARWLCGITLAVLAYLGLSVFGPALPPTAYLAAQAAGLGIGYGLAKLDFVRRMFLNDETMERCAQRRAAAAFSELGLRHTEHATGILILVALLEHRVVVLADRGIDQALGSDESWADVVELVLDGIAAGRPTDGIVAAVGRCGEILSHPLPAATDNPDEIRRELFLED